jgi:HK97 family phage major capsid protein
MNKRMRELQSIMAQKAKEAEAAAAAGEIEKANTLLDEVDNLEKEFNTLERVEKARKAGVPGDPEAGRAGDGSEKEAKVNGFNLIAKMMHRKSLSESEKAALISGENSQNGETFLVPEDVRAEINELRKSYVSAKHLVNVTTTDALAGSETYEAGVPTGLDDFDDGDAIAEEDGVKFVLKKFAIAFKGKLIPVSRILLGAAKDSLLNYLNRWFVKNAVLSENQKIFATLKAGYNSGAPKAVAGWKALKKSINVDLDPSCKIDGCIITNQSGFACLDEEEDADGRPVLKDNPMHETEKMFQSLPVYVFPDSHLPNIDGTHFPMIYGSTKAGATFVEHKSMEFAVSEHFLFNKNQNCLRVVEGFDVMSTDTSAYIYGSFSASAN